MVDLNDRKLTEYHERTPFVPRGAAEYRLRVISFGAFDSKSGIGWEAILEVKNAKETKKHAAFQPMAEAGKRYLMRWKRVDKEVWMVDKALKELRTFLAACNGEEHSEAFDANKAIAVLEKLDLESVNLEVILVRDSKVVDGQGANAGKQYVNDYDFFHPVAA